MKKSFIIFATALALVACGGNSTSKDANAGDSAASTQDSPSQEQVAAEETGTIDAATETAEMERVALAVLKSEGYNDDFTKNATKALVNKVQEPVLDLMGFSYMDVAIDASSMKVKRSDLEQKTVVITGMVEEPNYEEETSDRYQVSWRVSLVKEDGAWKVSAVKLL